MRLRRTPRSPHPHVAVAKRFWLATAAGDAEGLASVLAPDVEWRVPGEHPLSGNFASRAEMIDQIARFGESVDDARLEVQDILASALGALIHYRLQARRGDRQLDTEVHLHLEIDEGQIVRARLVPTEPAELDAFLSWTH